MTCRKGPGALVLIGRDRGRYSKRVYAMTTMGSWIIRPVLIMLIAALAGCAKTPPPVVRAPVVVARPAPPPPPMPMPTPPNSAAPDLYIPVTDTLGRRMTPNVDLGPEQALWHLRIALNVAALSCRGPDEAILVANYTRFLDTNRAAITRAERWVIADQARLTGTNGVPARDALSTRLYNYFAQPPVKTEFCSRATAIMAFAAAEPTATMMTFATARLPEIDQPFVDFYNAYARYQANYAAWRAQQPVPLTPVVSPTTLPPSSVAPGSLNPATPSTLVGPVNQPVGH